jgi:hypothetical protein
MIPVAIFSKATVEYLKNRWSIDTASEIVLGYLQDESKGLSLSDRIKAFWVDHVKNKVDIRQSDFKASIIEVISENLIDKNYSDSDEDYGILRDNLISICRNIVSALTTATADAARDTSRKRIRYHVADFRKSFRSGVTKADIVRYLGLLKSECQSPGPQFKDARSKLEDLETALDKESTESHAEVGREAWLKRLEQFASRPWS